ncbi:hypothetical protein ACTWPB_21350 [Nocardia sp. IBHARD005]
MTGSAEDGVAGLGVRVGECRQRVSFFGDGYRAAARLREVLDEP